MRLALRRAVRALGRTRPNPCVGAVVALGGRVLAVGHHARAGGEHAEVVALRLAGEAARGADLYVTLEPCSHHGRTPPCVDAILRAGVSRVFAATLDRNPLVRGQGLHRLRQAGVAVVEGPCTLEADALLAPFFTWVTSGRPLVTLKAAASLDGRVATSTGESRGLSGPRAHAWLHRLRDRVDAIMVGVGTALADRPRLTPRHRPLGGRGEGHLVRVVLDSRLRIPLDSPLFADVGRHPLLIFTGQDPEGPAAVALQARGAQVVAVPTRGGRVDLGHVLDLLGTRNVTSVLVEGGPTVHGTLLSERLAHRVAVVVTPCLLGTAALPLAAWPGLPTLAGAVGVANVTLRKLGDNALLEGDIRYPG
jgi:diaminohydroxyphosphoribosylaminopyrimidine deaminase/5-amino-6-(5-phosphoribosylamino)uracil reductase